MAIFAIILPFIIQLNGLESGWATIGHLVFFALIFFLAIVVGFEFLLASKLQKKGYAEISGITYSIDLLGSAFGAFLTTLVLLPLIGIAYSCMFVALLNIISGTMALSIRKSINL